MYEVVNTDPAQNKALGQYNESGAVPYRVRLPEQVIRFFDGLELADPVWWRSTSGVPIPAQSTPPPCPRWAESDKSREPRGYLPRKPARRAAQGSCTLPLPVNCRV